MAMMCNKVGWVRAVAGVECEYLALYFNFAELQQLDCRLTAL
jgi:hypothetical protein